MDVNYTGTLGITGWVWNTAGTYTMVENPGYNLKFLRGFRYLDLEEELEWEFSSNIASIPRDVRAGKVKAKDGVLDAIVGVRGRFKIADGN